MPMTGGRGGGGAIGGADARGRAAESSPGPAAARVAIVSRQVSGVTGTTTTILEHCRRLAALGFEPHVFGERLDLPRLAAAGAVSHRLPGLPFWSYPKRRLFAWLSERAAGGGRFDLVWGHGDILRQDVLSLHNCVHAAHEAVHGSPLPGGSGVGRIHRLALEGRGFRLLIATSELMRRDALRRFNVPPGAVEVVRPGCDLGRFKPADRERLGPALRRELGVAQDGLLAGLVTSGDFVKRGAGVFLRALAVLPHGLKKRTAAVVVGRELRAAPYAAAAAAAGLGGGVRFLQPVQDVERLYHGLDVYVHPALFEEFGQSVQEAMACGVPVLTSARVGASELLAGEARATLPEAPEPEALAKALAALLSDEGMRRRWSADNAAAVRGNTWDANFARTWELVAPLLRRPAHGRGSAASRSREA